MSDLEVRFRRMTWDHHFTCCPSTDEPVQKSPLIQPRPDGEAEMSTTECSELCRYLKRSSFGRSVGDLPCLGLIFSAAAEESRYAAN